MNRYNSWWRLGERWISWEGHAEDLVECHRNAQCLFGHNQNREECFHAVIDVIKEDADGPIRHTLEIDKVDLSTFPNPRVIILRNLALGLDLGARSIHPGQVLLKMIVHVFVMFTNISAHLMF